MIGASLLYHIDEYYSVRENLMYMRYMDDFLFLARSRAKIRMVVKRLYDYFVAEGFIIHPDKTFIGRISKGFDWLGIDFGGQVPVISARSVEKYRKRRQVLERQLRWMEQTARYRRLEQYDFRWHSWAGGMLRAADGSLNVY